MISNFKFLRSRRVRRTRGAHHLLCAGLSVVMAFCFSSRSDADEVDLQQLLHGPERCDHVIGMLMRYGVNNDGNLAANQAAFHPLGPVAIPMAELGDLQLISIERHAIATGCGPSFDLVIKNCSARDVCGARVTLVGLLGRIHPMSPSTTAKIESLPAGEAIRITMTLPLESLAMGNLNGQVIGMNRVLAVVDSFDQFMESNEANNLRVFDHAAIPMVVAAAVEVSQQTGATVEQVQTEVTTTEVTQTGTELTGVQQTGVQQTVTTQSSGGDTSSAVTESDLRSAIDQFSDDATTQQDAS